MILLVWVYTVAIGGLLAIAGLLLEWVAAARRRSRRWCWTVLLAVNVLIGLGAAAWRPALLDTEIGSRWMVRVGGLLASTGSSDQWLSGQQPGRALRPEEMLTEWDSVLTVMWAAGASVVMLIYVTGQMALRHRRRHWRKTRVLGVPVFLAPNDGPAVVGVWKSAIVLPQWALAFDSASINLMLSHEREHQRAHDPLLLRLAGLALMAMPWNPAAWWMLSRLRLAVEIDCDARVLAESASEPRGRDAASYSELLLTIAAHPCSQATSIAPAMFGQSSSLARRISAMYPEHFRFLGLRTASAVGIAVSLLTLAVLVPSPTLRAEPLGTASATQAREPGSAGPETAYEPGNGVSWPRAIKQAQPKYTKAAMEAKIQGEVYLAAVVETDGSIGRIRVTKSLDTKYGLDQAAIDATSRWKFEPAKKDGKPVPVRIEMVLDFRLH